MPKATIIAAVLLASTAASAQVYGTNCRGETMSDLARCAVSRTPPPVAAPTPETTGIAPLGSQTVRPTALGGSIRPSNLRAAPPLVGRAVTPSLTPNALPGGVVGFDPLENLRTDPTSPFYGIARDSGPGPIIRYDPLGGTAIGRQYR